MTLRVEAEYRLLLACVSHVEPDIQRPKVEQLMRAKPAWATVGKLAERHRLSAPLYLTLQNLGLLDMPPPEALRDLEIAYYQNIANHLVLQAELSRILHTLGSEGIPVVALKGAALLESTLRGQDPALRPMGDLDLLVREEHLDRADALIRGLGYRSKDPVTAMTSHLRILGHHYPTLVSPDELVTIELHRHLVDLDSPLAFDLSAFWARAVPTTVAGVPALIPCPEDLVLHLGLHFFLNRRASSRGAVGQLWDIAQTVWHSGDRLDWTAFTAEAWRLQLAGPEFLALFAAHALFGVPDRSVLDGLQPDGFDPSVGERFIERRVLDTAPWFAPSIVSPTQPFSRLNLVKGIVRRVFPSRRALALRYGPAHSWPVPLLYLRHFGEVALRLARVGVSLRQARRDLQIQGLVHDIAARTQRPRSA